jgi:FkbM family methyltransferase
MRGVGAGLKFNAGFSNPAYALGTNELPVQEALARYLQPGQVFYDIGANVGFITVIGAKLVGQDGHVYAFEPVPENAAFVRKNVALNNFSNVTVFEQAVSQSSGRGELLLAHHSGGATLSADDVPPDLKGSITVDLVTIDDLIIQQSFPPPDLVKVDVEGAEMKVFQGMVQTIGKFRPIIVYEIDDGNEQAFQRKQRECDTFLQNFGYKLTLLDHSYPGIGWNVSHTVATFG